MNPVMSRPHCYGIFHAIHWFLKTKTRPKFFIVPLECFKNVMRQFEIFHKMLPRAAQ